jgi:hypothetical protein
MSIDEFLYNYYHRPHVAHYRAGQALMNMLFEVKPEMYKYITATVHDCFYRDDIIPETLKFIKKNWEDFN